MALMPAIFLDKDGTLLKNVPYNVDPEKMEFAPGSHRALRRLSATGWPMIVISNQPGVALGYFHPDALVAVHDRLAQMFRQIGCELSGFYWCPHHPGGSVTQYARLCNCRKPEPGLLHRAAATHGVSLVDSWFIGDILDDVEAGNRAGCRSLLLDVGNETEWDLGHARTPACTAQTWDAAVDAVLAGGPLHHAGDWA